MEAEILNVALTKDIRGKRIILYQLKEDHLSKIVK